MRFVVDIKKIDPDKNLLGQKGMELAALSAAGINIQDGFVITTDGYIEFINSNKIRQKTAHLINAGAEEKIQKLFSESNLPENLVNDIFSFYRNFGKLLGDSFVTLVPSITDQHDYFKYSLTKVKGEAALIKSIKDIWISYFDEDYFLHRKQRDLSHFRNSIAIIVNKDISYSKTGFIENKEIITKFKLSEKEKNELLQIRETVSTLHFFPKKILWGIFKKKIYVLDILDTYQDAKKENLSTIQESITQVFSSPIGGIATGMVGKEIIIVSELDYDKLKEIKHAKGLVVENEITNPHIKIVLNQMGIPVVLGKKSDIANGMIATVDGIRNDIYKGEFKV